MKKWRNIKNIVLRKKQQVAWEYREKVEAKLRYTYNDALSLLEKFLIHHASQTESKIFYFKVKGEYYCYLAEVAVGDDKKGIEDHSKQP